MKKNLLIAVIAGLVIATFAFADSGVIPPKDMNGYIVYGALRPSTSHQVSLSTSSARTSSDFTTGIIRVATTVDCFVKLGGSSITATTTDSVWLPTGLMEYFHVGSNTRIAGITSSGTGTLHITEMK